MIHTIAQEIRQGVRRLGTDRAFTLAAVLLLGLGIGVNNMMFTVIYGHALRKLPIYDPDRVLYVATIDDRGSDRALSYPDLVDLRSANGFTGFAAYSGGPVTLADSQGAPERVEAAYVTSNGFDLIGRAPAAGRMFTAQEDTPGAPRAVLLGSSLAATRYGGGEAGLGRSILVNGTPARRRRRARRRRPSASSPSTGITFPPWGCRSSEVKGLQRTLPAQTAVPRSSAAASRPRSSAIARSSGSASG